MLRLASVIQKFRRPGVKNIRDLVASEFNRLALREMCACKRVGITVGSRGIADIVQVVSALVGEIKNAGGKPILLAAMGSHGGGTETGQRAILKSLGLTEQATGAPVVTCAVSQKIGDTGSGFNALILESALSVDVILPVNRIKPHTAFHGAVESGLHKMLVVGLGGPEGAAQFHSGGAAMLPGMLKDISETITQKLFVPAGFAIVENAYEETALIKGVKSEDFASEEPKILNLVKSLMPSLPSGTLDALVIEEIGKNYSGTGMDTNIIGRLRLNGVPEPESPSIQKIAVLDMSEDSHGNANGIGFADITTKRLVEKIDRDATNLNCATTGFLSRGATPIYLDTEREMMELLLNSLSVKKQEEIRLIQISDTLRLERCLVSEALKQEIENNPNAEITSPFEEMSFDEDGRLSCRLLRRTGINSRIL
jgi:hypothetical protein